MTYGLINGEPSSVVGIIHILSFLSQDALVYALLITVIALTAVFTSRPSRRKAALQVLRLLLPIHHSHEE